MTDWNRYSWQGTAADIAAAVKALQLLNIDPTILGPVTDDNGVSYIRVRSVMRLRCLPGCR
jgi:hypothetical protein